MAKSGGPANAHGILYQVLGTLGHGMVLSLRGTVEGDDLAEATLIIEPPDGGDVQIVSSDKCFVEQWKSRADGRPWSLTEIMEGVIPDLYLASTKDISEYRFVTSGRNDTWDLAYQFFRSLGTPPADGTPADALDDMEQIRWGIGHTSTKRQLFMQVVNAVKNRPSQANEEPDESQRRVWRVLSRFVATPPLKLDDLIERINRKLAAVVDHIEDVDAKRRELCGILLECCATGNLSISPEQLLARAGLKPDTFLGWDRLKTTLDHRLAERLQRAGYQAQLDVRSSQSLQSNRPVIVVTGSSGQGKSWRLAALAMQVTAGPAVAVWIPPSGGPSTVDQAIAYEIWCAGLNHDQVIPLERVAIRRKEINPEAPSPWALVCVDGIQRKQEANGLASLPWEAWGMRLAISAPRQVAEYLQRQHGDRVEIVEVSDLTPVELRDYLNRRDRKWASLPADVRELIRRPILARLFADLPEGTWLPHNEYQLMEACWNRIGEQTDEPSRDFLAMRNLAGTVFEVDSSYPWPAELIQNLGVSAESVHNLKQSGWLRETENGDIECTHDRLLCWAVAESVVQRLKTDSWSVDQAAQWLRTLEDQKGHWQRRLGYVAMDVMWLTCASNVSPSIRQSAWKLIESQEMQGGYGHHASEMYERLLPTLGERIIQPVVDRMKHAVAGSDQPTLYPHLVERCLRAVAKHAAEAVKLVISTGLHADCPWSRELSIRLLRHLPDLSSLDRLWELYSLRLAKREDDPVSGYEQIEILHRAMASCLQLKPSRIEGMIEKHYDNPELLAVLASLLADLDGQTAASTWAVVKPQLIERIEPDQYRSLIRCIMSFRDHEELPRLLNWARTCGGWVSPYAVLITAFFDPDQAAALVGEVPAKHLVGYTGKLRDILMALRPEQTCQVVRLLIAKNVGEERVYFELIGAGHRIDADTLDEIIDLTERRFKQSRSEDAPDEDGVFQLIDVLDGMHGRTVLDALRRRQGSDFERLLAQAACRHTQNSSRYGDQGLEATFRVLTRIGGDGMTTVCNAMLGSANQHTRLKGCDQAWIRPDAQTRQLLSSLAQSEETWGNGKESFPLVQQRAIDALAAIGADAELIRAVLKWGFEISPHVAELRSGQPAMTDNDIAPALNVLERSDHDLFPHAVLALGFTGRREFRPRLKQWLNEYPCESAVAKAAMLALEDLGGYDQDIRHRLIVQYRSGAHKYPALRLMGTAGEREAETLMKDAISEDGPYDEIDRRVIRYLASHPETRPLVARQVRRLLESRKFLFDWLISIPDLLDLEHQGDQQRLWDLASKPPGSFRMVGEKARAISRLAEQNHEVAFDLAESLLTQSEAYLDEIAPVMLQINEHRAIPLLLDAARRAYSAYACRIVALALRFGATIDLLRPLLKDMLVNEDSGSTRVAAEIAGYLGSNILGEELQKVILSHGDINVCCTCVTALLWQQRESEAVALISRFTQESGSGAAALAEEILHLADPDVLLSQRDATGFLAALSSKPFAFRKSIIEQLNERKEKIQNDLKSSRNRWDSDE